MCIAISPRWRCGRTAASGRRPGATLAGGLKSEDDPLKTGAIAEAKVRTDKVDASMLAEL
jgi:hypothetical protein